jgi:beta-N-acetylhexosaminidase
VANERPLGPVMVDVAGLELRAEEREVLEHPLVGGVILFARNYASPEQLRALTAAIHGVRTPPLLIGADHEGGRVQRFIKGFTRLPPMRAVGAIYDRDPALARNLARALGVVLAAEVAAHGVDFSFAPVLDVDFGASSVIGDRAFHTEPAAVATLASALVAGMQRIGVAAIGKHFPGHGFVSADSHLELPVDDRELAAIDANDLVPFRALIGQGLAGIMPAHVVYAQIDSRPAGFSRVWLQDILRGQLSFVGMIFSDDLSMEGAAVAGGVIERGRAALGAGCDMALVCNAPEAAVKLLDGLGNVPLHRRRAERMRGPNAAQATGFPDYRDANVALAQARDAGMLA